MQRFLKSGYRPCLAFFFAASAITPAYASEPHLKASDTAALAEMPSWLALLNDRPNRLSSGYTSQADDPDFFLSPNGKTSPQAELEATLEAIQAPGGGDDHARCRFPARDRWLRQHLDLPATPVSCPAYDEWRSTLNTETVTLVFAASYLNSPSSMFGHTFLRLDPPNSSEEADLLLASTISYAADAAAHDSELMFAYRGIFGGYPGITTVQPYYEKIRLYSDIENRDLWEYQLNLTPDETSMLMAHAWEIKDHNFDYYFFDENCAYRLLALIDVARPGTNLLDEVSTHAIPSDTVRWVVDHDLVSSVHYRPSSATVVQTYLDQLPPEQRELAAELADGDISVDDPRITALAKDEQAHVLDATYEYVRYQTQAEKWPRERSASLSYSLLKARSQLGHEAALAQPPEPEVRDDQGHDTFRVSMLGGQQDSRNFAQLTLRPAYHDLLDPPEGYRSGAQLQFLRLDARLYTDNDELQVEQLTAVEIRSLSVRDQFFSPLSWQVGFGARRAEIESGKRIITPYLDGGAGGGWAITDQSQLFAMATADMEIDNDLDKGFDAAPGVDFGAFYQGHRLSVKGGIRTKAWLIGGQHWEDSAYADASWHISRDLSLTTGWERRHQFDRYETRWQLGLNIYF
ncbi:Lnb N-terminal periplasmic domain-containing protein [Marinobacter sp. 1Y8]